MNVDGHNQRQSRCTIQRNGELILRVEWVDSIVERRGHKNGTARTSSSMMMKVMSSAGLAATAFTSMDAPENTKNTGIRKP